MGLRWIQDLPIDHLIKGYTGVCDAAFDSRRSYTSSKFKWNGIGACFMPAQRRHEPNRALTVGRARERTHVQLEGDVDG